MFDGLFHLWGVWCYHLSWCLFVYLYYIFIFLLFQRSVTSECRLEDNDWLIQFISEEWFCDTLTLNLFVDTGSGAHCGERDSVRHSCRWEPWWYNSNATVAFFIFLLCNHFISIQKLPLNQTLHHICSSSHPLICLCWAWVRALITLWLCITVLRLPQICEAFAPFYN